MPFHPQWCFIAILWLTISVLVGDLANTIECDIAEFYTT
jgi:hypothetical protein